MLIPGLSKPTATNEDPLGLIATPESFAEP